MADEEKRKYTIEDIARELGVSKTTVSRAISGKGRIGKDTRARVLRFIEEHDYRPNSLAKGLAQRKTYNIGLLLPLAYEAAEVLFFRDCMNGICKTASAKEYDVLISMTDGTDLAALRRMAANWKVDGVILGCLAERSAAQEYLLECGLPFVQIDSPLRSDAVLVSCEKGGHPVTEMHLQKAAYQKNGGCSLDAARLGSAACLRLLQLLGEQTDEAEELHAASEER